MNAPKELTALLRRFEPDVQATAVALRTTILEEVGPCYEAIFQFYNTRTVTSILYSTTEKRIKDNICVLVAKVVTVLKAKKPAEAKPGPALPRLF